MTYHNYLFTIVSVWIPTERTVEGIRDTNKPRDRVFGFAQGEKAFFDGIRNSLEEVAKQGAILGEGAAEGPINGENEMAMGILY